MKNILVNINRSLGSKYIFHTICDILDSLNYQYSGQYKFILLTDYSSKKKLLALFKNENRNFIFDDVIFLSEYFNPEWYNQVSTWQEIYDKIDLSRIIEKNIDGIIEIGSALSIASNMHFNKIDYEGLFNNNSQFKYVSVRTIKERVLFTFKLSKLGNIPINHFILDPDEISYFSLDKQLNYFRYFSYNSSIFDFSRQDAFLFKYRNLYKKPLIEKKVYDFVFGYTVLTKDRKNVLNGNLLEQNLSDLKTKIFVKDKFNNIDTFVKKTEYLKYLAASKFTLIVPAYLNKTFSAFRYIEAIYNDCVPLILKTNYIEEFSKDFFIPEELFVDVFNIKYKIQTIDQTEILTRLKEGLQIKNMDLNL